MTSSRPAALALAAAVLALGVGLTACSSTQQATADATTADQRGVVALGAGDALGQSIHHQHVLITGRDSWDRNAIIEGETTRLAEAIRLMQSAEDQTVHDPSARIASEPVPID